MKKFIGFVLIGLFVFCFSGCSSELTNLVKENMSDLRINYFSGESKNMYATLSCGYREEVFAYDGISTKKLNCGVLTVGFNDVKSYSSISVVLNVNGEESEFVLLHSPFEDSYMVDIEKIISEDSSVSLHLKNGNEIVNLKPTSKEWEIQADEAIKIACENFSDELNNLYFNGKLNAEGYLKIVSEKGFDKVFWYFSYIDRAGKTNSLLIDVNSGKVLKRGK